VRTIVVWKPAAGNQREPLYVCCVRTIVVWKQCYSLESKIFVNAGCVRTIVVWKLSQSDCFLWQIWLRENHSGMETENAYYVIVVVAPVA